MDDEIQDQADDSAPLSPPLPVVVGDIEYLYRKDPNYDRSLDDIDWENLAFEEPEEFDPKIHAYCSSNYATEEEASAALEKLFEYSLREALRAARAKTAHPDDEPR
jgi:hypothetical protein